MNFKIWLENSESNDYQGKTWYHGTTNLTSLLQSKRIKTREEGVRARNAAAMGVGIYLTDDLEEAQAYVPIGTLGGVVGVKFIKPVNLLRLHNNNEDNQLFELIRSMGLNDPKKTMAKVKELGFEGVHWDMIDGSQKIVTYDPNVLSDVTLITKSNTTHGTLDRTWENIN